ncbi:hypothetical protein EHQ76_07485 [Leptospira barantonii]|uniref:Uncharacterized protein n=1 Tax=Leptospira barantonii TaxID=2023184 RepID=A0A5F2BH33_9LEPT|nr:hypothetical protein [Leptospira barantonii]TGM04876.1 hypothetical protein EHQ76_07485 [Leptospira barantonii]
MSIPNIQIPKYYIDAIRHLGSLEKSALEHLITFLLDVKTDSPVSVIEGSISKVLNISDELSTKIIDFLSSLFPSPEAVPDSTDTFIEIIAENFERNNILVNDKLHFIQELQRLLSSRKTFLYGLKQARRSVGAFNNYIQNIELFFDLRSIISEPGPEAIDQFVPYFTLNLQFKNRNNIENSIFTLDHLELDLLKKAITQAENAANNAISRLNKNARIWNPADLGEDYL